MSELLSGLLEQRAGARESLLDRFDHSWTSDDQSEANNIIDALSTKAETEPVAMDLLLSIIDSRRLPHSALARLLINPSDIDDAAQATLAIVALRVGQFDGRARFTTWLHQVATNEAKMLIRSRERRPQATEELQDAGYLAHLSTIVANKDAVDAAMHSLPKDLRIVLTLREVEGLDYDTIATRLDLAIGTVRSRLHRARHDIAESLRTQGF